MKKLSIIMAGCLIIAAGMFSNLQAQTTIPVSGNLSSIQVYLTWTANGLNAQTQDTWTGDITGRGITHIYSSDPLNPVTGEITNIVFRFHIFTDEGNMVWDGLGNSVGPFLTTTATLVRGTGIYKNATGTFTSSGLIGPTGIESTWTGTITLED
jgi:hypothetical protein